VVTGRLAPFQRGPTALLELLGGVVAGVGPPLVYESVGDPTVEVEAFGRPVRAAHARSLVPVQAEPAERADDGLDGLLGGPLEVGVLDAQDELSPVVA